MESKQEKSKKSVFSVVCTVLTIIIAILAAAILINVIVSKTKNKPISFFGISFSIVQTNSMEPEIMTGDLIIIRKCKYEDIKVGDHLVFIADKNFDQIAGQSIVHQVKEITDKGIITYGVNNHTDDKGFRAPEDILGICTANSAFWGKVFKFLGKYGIFIILVVVALPFIIGQIVKIVRLAKEKDEDDATPEIDREKIREELILEMQNEQRQKELEDSADTPEASSEAEVKLEPETSTGNGADINAETTEENVANAETTKDDGVTDGKKE